jgi:hypothetical protein
MELTAKGQPLDVLAQMPFFGLGSPVVNKTGLAGVIIYLTNDDRSAILSLL